MFVLLLPLFIETKAFFWYIRIMSLTSLFRKITGKRDTHKLILGVIEVLKIDEKQKDLYRQALEILNTQEKEGLYQTLLETMKKFERAEGIIKFSQQTSDFSGLRRKEVEAKVREEHSASILIDNI